MLQDYHGIPTIHGIPVSTQRAHRQVLVFTCAYYGKRRKVTEIRT